MILSRQYPPCTFGFLVVLQSGMASSVISRQFPASDVSPVSVVFVVAAAAAVAASAAVADMIIFHCPYTKAKTSNSRLKR